MNGFTGIDIQIQIRFLGFKIQIPSETFLQNPDVQPLFIQKLALHFMKLYFEKATLERKFNL